MPQKTTTPPDWDAIADALSNQMGAPSEIENPQLGRVMYRPAKDLWAMLGIIGMMQAQASGVPTTGVFVVGYDRGLAPKGGC
jgi:hypothetical protein